MVFQAAICSAFSHNRESDTIRESDKSQGLQGC